MAEQTFTCPFGIGDWVIFDGDASIRARVVMIRFSRTKECECLCSWFDNHGLQDNWIELWRLSSG